MKVIVKVVMGVTKIVFFIKFVTKMQSDVIKSRLPLLDSSWGEPISVDSV